MKNLYQFILLLTVSTITLSCSNDLEQEPISIISNDSFWKTKDDAKAGLLAAYTELRDRTDSDMYVLGEGRSEILGLGLVGDGGFRKYYENTLNADDAGPSWQGFYRIINTANLVIKNVPNIDFDVEGDKNNILAEAYTMRAYVYFVMARTWGDLIIHTEPIESSNADVTIKSRSSTAEVFSLIKSDLEMALSLYPNNELPNGRNRWSKAGANALKGNVFLWTGKMLGGGAEDFNIALNAFNDVVDTPNLNLLPNYSDVHNFDNKGNNEIIMGTRYDQLESTNNYIINMYIRAQAIPNDVDSETLALIGVPGGNTIIAPTKLVVDQFSLDDSRRSGTFLEIFSEDKLLTIIAQKNTGTVIDGSRNFLGDIVLYRLADILLMRAETLNALGQDPSEDINTVRMRAYGDNYPDHIFVSNSQSINDEEILKERLFELSLEGKRWWDLIRFNKVFDLVPSLQDKNDTKYLLWPISNGVLSTEPKVEQNPGWGF